MEISKHCSHELLHQHLFSVAQSVGLISQATSDLLVMPTSIIEHYNPSEQGVNMNGQSWVQINIAIILSVHCKSSITVRTI